MSHSLQGYQLPTIATRIGKDAQLKGTLRFSSNLKISGRFEGTIDAKGFLFIEEGALIKAEVLAEEVVIAGEVHGNVEAKRGIELLPGSHVYGNLKAATLRIADGVIFEGKCEMIRNVEEIDVFSSVLKDLRRSIRLSDEEQQQN